MLLASALETNGNMEGSCAALALAVWSIAKKHADASLHDSKDNSSVGNSWLDEILLFPRSIIFYTESLANKSMVIDGLAVMVSKHQRVPPVTPLRNIHYPLVLSFCICFGNQ